MDQTAMETHAYLLKFALGSTQTDGYQAAHEESYLC